METGLYRIAQEALSNVERHSSTEQAWLRLILLPDQVTLVIEDNGQGFDPSQTEPGHFGIIGLVRTGQAAGWQPATSKPHPAKARALKSSVTTK